MTKNTITTAWDYETNGGEPLADWVDGFINPRAILERRVNRLTPTGFNTAAAPIARPNGLDQPGDWFSPAP